jgi:hypothetical protein
MAETYSEKGRLPACILDEAVLAQIWSILGEDGDFLWQAVVGTGGDLIGLQKERPREIVTDLGRLKKILATLRRIDSLQFTAEIAGKGAISFTFCTYNPPAGALVVASQDAAWTAARSSNSKLCLRRGATNGRQAVRQMDVSPHKSVVPLTVASLPPSPSPFSSSLPGYVRANSSGG